MDADAGAGGLLGSLSAIPSTIGQIAVAGIKFVTQGGGPSVAQDKVSTTSSNLRPGMTESVVKPMIDLSDPGTITAGVLGVGALGTLAYSLVAAGKTLVAFSHKT